MFLHALRTPSLCRHGIVATLFMFCLSALSHAQTATAEKEIQAAVEGMQAVAVQGPLDVSLGAQASIRLPEDFTFVPKAEAERFMHAVGNQVAKDFIGLIFSVRLEGFVSVEFTPAGYIKDDDARDWNVDDLLQSLKDGAHQGNVERTKRGLPEIEVLGWIEKPAYDASTHRLVWSISAQQKGGGSIGEEQGVNYNTYLLGREGYLSLNLVTDNSNVEEEKPVAKQLLTAVSFNTGQRYEDFNAATDRVAEYGLAALVGGLAVKKLGLLAALGVFLLKTWKIVLIGVIAFGALFKRLFGRKTAS
ncbi:MAG: DUF2167 domain-containing protein [Azoarcus sp.]|jgi:uncharacterized membrane-anchored protein|nr:DUF2167 domain-containing protein [Azoarcus sp.]